MTYYLRTHTTCPWCRMRFEIGEPQRNADVARCAEPKCKQRVWFGHTARGIAPKDLRVKGMTK